MGSVMERSNCGRVNGKTEGRSSGEGWLERIYASRKPELRVTTPKDFINGSRLGAFVYPERTRRGHLFPGDMRTTEALREDTPTTITASKAAVDRLSVSDCL